ncbi:MAG: hypothetical protein WDA16_07160 [Candidatus Thermoplasmatota archaeon]
MVATRLTLYLVGLVVIVAAVWVALTMTPLGRQVPSSVALVLILLVVGIGVMASARNINESRRTSHVVHDGTMPPVATGRVTGTRYAPPGYVERETYVEPAPVSSETIVDERRSS